MPVKYLSDGLKVKVTHECHMIKWSLTELVWVITCTFMHDFQLIWHSFSLGSRNAI